MKTKRISKTIIEFTSEEKETIRKMGLIISELKDISSNFGGCGELYSEVLGQAYWFEDFINDVDTFLEDLYYSSDWEIN